MRFHDSFHAGSAAESGGSHLLRAVVFAVLGTLVVGDAWAQVDVLWSSYYDGSYYRFKYDEAQQQATLVTLGDNASHYYKQGVNGNELGYERIPVGVDGIMRFGSDFVAWTEETIPYDRYWKAYETRLVVTGVTSSGEEKWRFQVTEPDDLRLLGGVRDAEGNFVFAAENSSRAGANTLLYKLSSEGAATWSFRLGSYLWPFLISQDEQDNYVVFATNMGGNEAPDSVTACPVVIRVSEAGDVLSRNCMLVDAPGYRVLARASLSDGSVAILLGGFYVPVPLRLVRVRLDGQVVEASPPLPLSGSRSKTELAMAISNDTLLLASRELNSKVHLTWVDRSYQITKEVVVDAGEIADYRLRRIVPVGFGTYLIAGSTSDDAPSPSFMARIWIEGEGAIEDVDESIHMFPNPARNSLFVSFELSRPERAGLLVHDVAGRSVYRRAETILPGGSHTFQWNGHDDHGIRVPSGVYLVTLIRGGERETQSVSILR